MSAWSSSNSDHRLACDTHAPLFWESGPLSRFAHMPPPRSSRTRLSPSIWVNSNLHVGFTIRRYPECSSRKTRLAAAVTNCDLINLRKERSRCAALPPEELVDPEMPAPCPKCV